MRKEMKDRIPPQAVEIEMAVIGAMMLDKDAVYRAMEILQEDYFYKTAHQRIFNVMSVLFAKNQAIDLITVSEQLKKDNRLEEVGGTYYLTECINQVTSTANVEYHAKIIRDLAKRRKLIKIGSELVENCYNFRGELKDIQEPFEIEWFNVCVDDKSKGFRTFYDLSIDTLSDLDMRYKRGDEIMGMRSGFGFIDRTLCGLNRNLTVIAGRPGMGKSSLAANIAVNLASKGIPVAIFSIEMDYRQLIHRIWARCVKIDSQTYLRPKYLGKEGIEKTAKVSSEISGYPIFIDDSGSLTGTQAFARSRRVVMQEGVQCIIVDHLQRMFGDKSKKRVHEIEELSWTLKTISKDLRVSVLMLSQLNRSVEGPDRKGSGFRPRLSDLRESGSIEQDADDVLFLYRPDLYSKMFKFSKFNDQESKWYRLPFIDSDGRVAVEFIVAKNRYGPIDTGLYYWDMRINDYREVSDLTDELYLPDYKSRVAGGLDA